MKGHRSGRQYWQIGAPALALVLAAGCAVLQGPAAPTAVPPTPAGRGIDVTNDVVFATSLYGDATKWKLDVYAPIRAGSWPVMLFTHGFGGNRKGYVALSQAIAERGAVVFTFDWPATVEDIALRDDGRGVREMIETAACAVRFAKARALQYGGDPERVTLGGHSYGGYIVAWVGLAGGQSDRLWDEFASERGGPPPQVECVEPGGSARVDAIVAIAGGYNVWDVPRYWEKAPDLLALTDPYGRIGDDGDLRVRLIHGENDDLVPVSDAVSLNEALAEAGYDTKLTLWEGGHGVPIDLTVEQVLELSGG